MDSNEDRAARRAAALRANLRRRKEQARGLAGTTDAREPSAPDGDPATAAPDPNEEAPGA
ncbi:hypothetical protein F1C10_10425 [Sphingomonas sp. NBWT7]|uniref:hypothetical protein n=1 Tax=Sphingomonas sp. NBWT7 TaxID=2596913 RepID=UPI00162824B1|nr:hypothetical protein [Sphingomonas sp. NBWT7]QNE32320.1 hypothetical protein F1C10_10425 [Sphingomonas sp. NBWT7]